MSTDKKVKKELSELSDQELLDLFKIARGVYSDQNYPIKNVQRWSCSDIMVTLGTMNVSFGIVICENQNDARLAVGYSFIMKEWLPKSVLSVTEDGLNEEKEDFAEEKMVLVLNQNILFERLESMGYL